jgi:hypothetical protein
MDIGLFQAQWILGMFPAAQVPDFAASLMVAGFEGPAILELASFHKPTRWDIKDELVQRALAETGAKQISTSEARRRVAEDIARKIISREIHPYDGAHLIWSDVVDDDDWLEDLAPFVGLASEYEDLEPSRRAEYLPHIIAYAKEFVEKRSASSG